MGKPDTSIVIQQINEILEECDNFHNTYSCPNVYFEGDPREDNQAESHEIYRIISLIESTIKRFDETNGVFNNRAQIILNNINPDNDEKLYNSSRSLKGVLTSLKEAYEKGYLISIQDLIHSDIFSDYLEMASELLEKNYKDPAAVITGSTLETHLKSLAIKNGINIEETKPNGDIVPKRADKINNELGGIKVYSKAEQKQITAWLDLRNKAAHGNYNEYAIEQIDLMLMGVRDFIIRNPA
ncbi:hypothetical protein [uncultured Methanospirillum sp.]|uniref:hypothetical protein n=1 Tax=uncultured Methanospirillum sp. TaxID=262503 RepID=UPI0029C88616|nr:hypothetical protein [uncultured Methanospirillum sp.]